MSGYALQEERETWDAIASQSAPKVDNPAGKYDYLCRVIYAGGSAAAFWVGADSAREAVERLSVGDVAAVEVLRAVRV